MKKFISAIIAGVMVVSVIFLSDAAPANAQTMQSMTRKTENATRKTYSKSKRGTKKGYYKAKRGTKWTFHKTKRGTKWTSHKVKVKTKKVFHRSKRAVS